MIYRSHWYGQISIGDVNAELEEEKMNCDKKPVLWLRRVIVNDERISLVVGSPIQNGQPKVRLTASSLKWTGASPLLHITASKSISITTSAMSSSSTWRSDEVSLTAVDLLVEELRPSPPVFVGGRLVYLDRAGIDV